MVTMTQPLPPRRGLSPLLVAPSLTSVQHAAEWIGRPVGTLYRWHREGRIRLRGRRGHKVVDLRELDGQEYNEGASFPAPPPVRHPPKAG